MRLTIRGRNLPGRTCGVYSNVHVGLQVKRDPSELVRGDGEVAEWVTEIQVVDGDCRGPAVQGKKGARFVYLTWGTVDEGEFTMFRRAKLMLSDLPLEREAVEVGVDLTDECGMPRSARLSPPTIRVA